MSKTTTTARKRTIRFNKRVEIFRIDPHSTYTEEERSRSWYTPRECRFFRKNQQQDKTADHRSKFIEFILQQQRDEHEHQQTQHTRNRRTQQQQQRDEQEHQQQLTKTRNRRLGNTRDLLREAEQAARTRAPVQPSRVSSFGQPIPLESSRAVSGTGTANQRWSIEADIRQPPRRIATYPTPLKNLRRSPRVQQPQQQQQQQQQQQNQQHKPTEQRWSSNAKEAIPKQDLSPFMPLRHISNTMLCALR